MNLNLIESLNENPRRIKIKFLNALRSVPDYFDSNISTFYIILFTRVFEKEQSFAYAFIINLI
jgi:hypothetical protein